MECIQLLHCMCVCVSESVCVPLSTRNHHTLPTHKYFNILQANIAILHSENGNSRDKTQEGKLRVNKMNQ